MKSYYLTMRPPTPYAMPTDGLVNVEEYSERKYIPAILHEAYARLSYGRELTKEEISDFELIPETYEVQLTRSTVLLLSDMLKESANLHMENADKYYEIYKKLCEAVEG